MAPFTRHIVHQRKVLASLGGVAARALLQPLRRRQPAAVLPGRELQVELAAPPTSLVRDYLSYLKAETGPAAETIPPHLFPHWGMPLAAQTLHDLPYPLLRIVNAGCRLQVNGVLLAGRPLFVRAQLESVDDDGRRAVLTQRIVTGQRHCPEALVARVHAVVPLRSSKQRGPRKRKQPECVPRDSELLDTLQLSQRAGLEYALLAGDFNPVHWVRPYARAFGHAGTILHGFASMAHVYESLQRSLGGSARCIRSLEVRFVRPLVLPASVGVYRSGTAVFAGTPGEPAFVTGSYAFASEEEVRGPVSAQDEGSVHPRLRVV
jgi:acyl dehydratase